MARLVNRNMQIPGGFRFRQAETKWQSRRFASFDTIVNSLIAHRKANRFLTEKHKWPTDYASVAEEVDAFNAALCLANGWTKYVTLEGVDHPKTLPSLGLARLRNAAVSAAAGVMTLKEMFGEGEQPVARQKAEARAAVCAVCPKNQQGDWLRFFTEPAARLIRATLAFIKDMNLVTTQDANLHRCDACDCPMKLKVWAPIQHIRKHLPPDVPAKLHETCWIPKE